MEKKKIAVAVSGGVDSSVAAALLLKQGHDICGVTMIVNNDKDGKPDDKAVKEAKEICNQLGIKHYVADLREQFYEEVIKPFAKAYASGKTPNPCVICNEKIKFGALLKFANSLGYDYLATGHYLNLKYDEKLNVYRILEAKDRTKDQAYMLYRLNQNILRHSIFPLHNYTKSEVYEIARELQLIGVDREESQDICFISDTDTYSSFLEDERLIEEKKGYFIDFEGNKLIEHKGLHNYTIGQRKGLGIALGYPAYVIKIDYDTGNIKVGEKKHLFSKYMVVTNVNWIADVYNPGAEIDTKVRYSTYKHKAIIKKKESDDYYIEFYDNVRAITPGQSAVFFSGEELIGGGIIKSFF